jgi:hypothetical protein
MNIESIIRRQGGTKVELDGVSYHFEPIADGRHVAFVEDEDHIGKFLAIPEGYRIAKGVTAAAPPQADDDGKRDASHPDGLHIHHIGRGRWAVFLDDQRVTNEPMTKDEAEAELSRRVAEETGEAQD